MAVAFRFVGKLALFRDVGDECDDESGRGLCSGGFCLEELGTWKEVGVVMDTTRWAVQEFRAAVSTAVKAWATRDGSFSFAERRGRRNTSWMLNERSG